MNRPIHGILFDLGNTLADREEAFLRWARWFAATHLEIADDGALAEAIAALALFDGNGATPKDEFFRAVKTRYPTMIGALENHVTTFGRRNPDILNGSRRRRIAIGSGTTAADVNRLLKQYGEAKKLMQMMSGGGKGAGGLRRLLGF